MKSIKIFSILAALTLGATAWAASPKSQISDWNSLKSVNATKNLAKANSEKASWSEWEDFGTATFSPQYWYRNEMTNLKVMKRTKTTDSNFVQFKVCGMFGGTPGYDPIDLVIDANFGVEGPTSDDVYIWVDDQYIESYEVYGEKTDIYLCDAYTYYETFYPNNPDYALAYDNSSYFRKETGEFYIYSYYHYADGTVPYLDAFYKDRAQGTEILQLDGAQYKHYKPEISNGRFNVVDGKPVYLTDVKIKDLSKIKMMIVSGTVEDGGRAAATLMNNDEIDYTTVTEDGTAVVDFDGTAGDYSLVYLTYKASGKAYQFGIVSLSYDPDWKSIGTARFTDGFISKFLETDLTVNHDYDLTEDDYTYDVEVEESQSHPGNFRIVNPYGSTSPYYNLTFTAMTLNKSENFYLYINATDPDKVYIPDSKCGFYYGTEPLVHYSEAYDWLNDGYTADQIPANLWGKYKDNVITFDAGDEENNLLSVKILSSPAAVYGRALKLDFTKSGIRDITTPVTDSPAQYYNLNGMRVDASRLTPGVYIKLTDGRATKLLVK